MRAYFDIPREIPEDESDFIILFNLPDVNDTLVEYAYKVTAEDRAAIIAAEAATKEKALAAELAEIDPALAEKIKQWLVLDALSYTDGNTETVLDFKQDNTITVTPTIAGHSISNSGIYSVRKEAILIEYKNGKRAKLPYKWEDGNIPSVTGLVAID